MTVLRFVSLFLLLATPARVVAHPHVFIDARIEILFSPAGQAESVRVTWIYDAFATLTILAELGLDPDLDGSLTPVETASLVGFDMNWQKGFQGDTYALLGGRAVDLGPPMERAAGYENGQLSSVHLRRFEQPLDIGQDELVIQAYDPSYYNSYLVGHASLSGAPAGCAVQIFTPDLSKADETLKQALSELTPDMDAEAFFPAIGAAFAEEARVSCRAP